MTASVPGAATIARVSIDFLAAVARRPSSPAPLQVIVVNVVVVAIVVGIGRRGEEGDIVAGIGQGGGEETSTPPPAVARGGGGAGGLGAQDDSVGEEPIAGALGIHVGEARHLHGVSLHGRDRRRGCLHGVPPSLSSLSYFYIFGRGHA